MGRPKSMKNLFKPDTPVLKHNDTGVGQAGYDNARENIDPHIRTGAVTAKEGTVQGTPTNAKDIVNKEYVDANDHWDRTGTILSPKTAGDDVKVTTGDISANGKVFLNQSGMNNYVGVMQWRSAGTNRWDVLDGGATQPQFSIWNNIATEQVLWCAADDGGNQLILTNYLNRGKDHDHIPQTNPTLYIHSDKDPDTDNTEWVSIHHDQTDGNIEVAKGDLNITASRVNITDGTNENVINGATWGWAVGTDTISGVFLDNTAGDNIAIMDPNDTGGYGAAGLNIQVASAMPAIIAGGDVIIENALSTTALSPAEITGNTNDWAVNTNSFVRYTADGEYNLTGIVAGEDGQRMTLANIGANKVTLKNQDANSDAVNRFLTNTGGDLEVTQNGTCELIYDAQTARWRVKC